MPEPKRVGECLAVKVLAQGKFFPGSEATDHKKREVAYFATSVEAALQRAEFDCYRCLTGDAVHPDSVKNEPMYDLGEAWAKRHKPSGNFIKDTYPIGGRVLE